MPFTSKTAKEARRTSEAYRKEMRDNRRQWLRKEIIEEHAPSASLKDIWQGIRYFSKWKHSYETMRKDIKAILPELQKQGFTLVSETQMRIQERRENLLYLFEAGGTVHQVRRLETDKDASHCISQETFRKDMIALEPELSKRGLPKPNKEKWKKITREPYE